MIALARILSIIFSPLLMATYSVIIAMTLSYLCFSPLKARLIVTLVTLVATCAIPVIGIFLMTKFGIVKDPALNERKDRTFPYILTTACFIGTAVYYHYVNAPTWLSMCLIGGAISLIVLTIVNRSWKMSGHATGMGGLVAITFYLMTSGNSVDNIMPEFITIVMLAGMVCTSRLLLERHTLAQVGAGFANGFIFIYLFAWMFQASALPALH